MPPRRASKQPGTLKSRRLGCCSSKQKKRFRRFVCVNPGTSSEESALENHEDAQREGIPLEIMEQEVQVQQDLIQNQNIPDNSGNETDGSSMDSLHLSGLWPEDQQQLINNSSQSSRSSVSEGLPEKPGIPKAPFKRLCQGVLRDHKPGFRFRAVAIEALQVASEDYLKGLFSDCGKSAGVRNSRTIKVEDLRLVLDIRESVNVIVGSPFRNNDGGEVSEGNSASSSEDTDDSD